MSNKQPEALRLADNLETLRMNTATNDQAAAELRRLHTVNQALVEALHHISLASQNSMSSKDECGKIARAALTAATGDQHEH